MRNSMFIELYLFRGISLKPECSSKYRDSERHKMFGCSIRFLHEI